MASLDTRRLPIPELAGRVLVVGLDVTGLSCVRYLAPLGAAVAVVDSREAPPGLDALRNEFPYVPVSAGNFAPEFFERADLVLLSPGVPVSTPEVVDAFRRGVPVWSDIELFARLNDVPIVAITGSNGKSTVTALLGSMAERAGLRAGVGGNIGIAALDLLAHRADVRILELSSFQLETTFSLDAAASVVLNIAPDHMDRYANLGEYAAVKARIYRGNGVQVINVDDPLVRAMTRDRRKLVRFTLTEPDESDFGVRNVSGRAFLCHGEERLLAAEDLRISGHHNVANALAALALSSAVGMDRHAVLSALAEFAGLPHRCQYVAESHGVRFYNDSKGTNVSATVAAIQGLGVPVVLIAGGQGKGQDFTPLAEALANRARGVVLIGEDAPAIRQALAQDVLVCEAADMPTAVQAAAHMAQAGDAVLLSPACASFDMFSDYKARGLAFVAAVEGLGS